jgi:hypothetical protein
MTLRFRSRIEINKVNPYVLIRADQAARLKSNWRRPMPVRVKVNGTPDTPWRTSRRKEILRYFAGLKSAAAQDRNVRKALHVLAGGKARFMAREWNSRVT